MTPPGRAIRRGQWSARHAPGLAPDDEADLPAVQAMADRLHPHHPEAPGGLRRAAGAGPRRLPGAGGGRDGCSAMPSPIPGPGRRRRRSMRCSAPCRSGRGPGISTISRSTLRRGAAAMPRCVLRSLLAASPLPRATLVAIPGTGDYWMRQGFRDSTVAMRRPWRTTARAPGSWCARLNFPGRPLSASRYAAAGGARRLGGTRRLLAGRPHHAQHRRLALHGGVDPVPHEFCISAAFSCGP